MKKAYHTRLVAIVALLATVCGAFAGSPHTKWERDAQKRKIDYLYMEAERQNALENNEGSFHLYRRAYQMDTTDTQIGSRLAIFYVAAARADHELGIKGLNMLQRRFNAHPSDRDNAFMYGQLMEQFGDNDEALHVWHILDSILPDKIEVTQKYVDALIVTRDSANQRTALSHIDKLERALGYDTRTTTRKVIANINLGDTAAAIRAIDTLLIKAPLIADNYVFAGNFQMSIDRPDEAIKYYDKACLVDSTSGPAFYTRADYYRVIGDSVAFNRETEHALLETDLDTEIKEEIMLNYVREFYADSTRFNQIDALFTKLLEKNPHESAMRDLYASFLSSTAHYKEAAEQQEYSLNLNPSDAEKWVMGGVLYMQAGEPEKAIETLDNGIHFFPDKPELYYLKASSYATIDKVREAIPQLLKAYSLCDSTDYKTRSDYLGYIGDFYHTLEETDSAFAYYDKALETNPDNLMVMNNLAYQLACMDRNIDRAESLSLKTVLNEPENPTYLDTYAWILFKRHEYVKAKEYIDRAIEHIAQPNWEINEHAGDIYFMLGMPDEAVEFWEVALNLNPDNPLLRKKVKEKTYFYN